MIEKRQGERRGPINSILRDERWAAEDASSQKQTIRLDKDRRQAKEHYTDQAELARYYRDAMRYRWLRAKYVKNIGIPSVKLGRDDADQFDDSIDEAMK